MAAIAGGAIVGMPLIYTMEMWFHGMTLSPWHVLGILGATLIVNFFFCLISGFRNESGAGEAVMESITSVGIALVFAALLLWLISAIDRDDSPGEAIGKIVIEAAAVSLGVAFANVHFRGKSRVGEDDDSGNGTDKPEDASDLNRAQLIEDVHDIGATIAGSVVFALNMAPTEEVVFIAARLDPWSLLLVLAATLLLCYVILYASGFEDQPVHVDSVTQSPWAETALTVGVSLLVSLALLWLLGERSSFGSVWNTVGAVVTLGLPATVGGAAGRLVV